jgi:peptide/nickel transport system permease protein
MSALAVMPRRRHAVRPAPSLVVSILFLLTMVVLALAGEVVFDLDAITQNLTLKLEPPSTTHVMGTDELGRDVLSRVVAGSRVSLAVGFGSALIGAAVGSAIGVLAGYASGIWDELSMRIVDVLIAFPAVILAMAVVAVAGSTLQNVVLVLAIVQLPIFARLARSIVLTQRELDYIAAARTVGVPPLQIVTRHVVPNALGPLIAMTGLVAAGAILNEAAMSFLGLGVTPPTPTWGNMLAGGRLFVMVGAWWVTVFPGLAIFATVLAFNVAADELQAALDPRRLSGT